MKTIKQNNKRYIIYTEFVSKTPVAIEISRLHYWRCKLMGGVIWP